MDNSNGHRAALLLVWGLSAALTAAESGNGTSDWPCWRGPNSSGATGDSGFELVDSPAAAKLLWQSEQETPGVQPSNGTWGGGYGDVVVADGRVYFFCYACALDGPMAELIQRNHSSQGGTWTAADAAAKRGQPNPEKAKYLAAIDADDVLLCLDADSGKTLWKMSLWRRGLGHYRYSPQATPAVWNGRAYVFGSSGRVYCLDAATGKPLWESDIGPAHEQLEQLRELWHATKMKTNEVSADFFDSCPLVADGVVVLNMHDRNDLTGKSKGEAHGLIGLDAQTGRKLWAVPNCLDVWASPVKWTHGGKAYVLATWKQRAAAIEARTGKLLWEVKGAFSYHGTVAVSGDYLVTHGNYHKGGDMGASDDAFAKLGPACYRLSAEGLKKTWSFGPDERHGILVSSPIIYRDHAYIQLNGDQKRGLTCVELATGKVVAAAPGGSAYPSPVAADGRIVWPGGAMYDANPKNFRKLDGVLPHEGGWAAETSPAIAGGRLYFRGGSALYCYDLRKNPAPLKPAPALPALPKDLVALATLAASGKWPDAYRAGEALRKMGAAAKNASRALAAALPEAVKRKSWGDAWLLVETLKAVDPAALQEAAKAVAELCAGQDQELRLLTCRVLGECGAQGAPGVAALAALLRETDTETVQEAAKALQRIGAPAKDAASALAALLKHSDAEVRYRAARALGAIGAAPPEALADLVKAFEQDDRFIWFDPDCEQNRQQNPPPWAPYRARGWVSQALLKLGKEAAPTIVGKLKSSTSNNVALVLASALVALAPDDRETAKLLADRIAAFGSPQGVDGWVNLVVRELPAERARQILQAGAATGNDRKRQIVRDSLKALAGNGK
jgi:outer membrane protein assembly factor BamB